MRSRYHFRNVSSVFIVVTVFLAVIGLLLPNSARASVILSAATGSTFGFATNAGASDCFPSDPSVTTASVFTCTDAAGDSQEAHAAAAPGVLGAEASVLAIPCDSSSRCAANVGAAASSTDPAGLIIGSSALSGTTTTTLNIGFNASVSQTSINDSAEVTAEADVAGQLAVSCGANTGGKTCVTFPVTVPLNTPISLFLSLSAGAQAQAGFSQLGSEMALADASHTFGFVPGAQVFDLPDGVTANDPDMYIFNNVFLPPDTTAVPEPSTALMLIVGLAGLGVLHRSSSRSRVHSAGA